MLSSEIYLKEVFEHIVKPNVRPKINSYYNNAGELVMFYITVSKENVYIFHKLHCEYIPEIKTKIIDHIKTIVVIHGDSLNELNNYICKFLLGNYKQTHIYILDTCRNDPSYCN